MYARELVPKPRCRFVGEDEETQVIVRCGRWVGHPHEHIGKHIVLEQMCEALAAMMGNETTKRQTSFADYVVLHSAFYWYETLVIE